VAAFDGAAGTVTLKLIGSDGMSQLSVQRKVKAQDATDESLIQAAARLAFDTVQERWKLTRDTYVAAGGGGTETGMPAAGGGGGLVSIQLTAQFSGLKEWQAIRTRLQNLPGVQNWDLRSVNPRSAQIGFDFPGGVERLTAMAGAQGLSVTNGPEGLIVKTR
jgi:hypothetical protein